MLLGFWEGIIHLRLGTSCTLVSFHPYLPPYKNVVEETDLTTCVHTDHANHGYATEALKAFIPFYFSLVPPSSAESDSSAGRPERDYMEARTDFENYASQRVLVKCGFTLMEGMRDTFNNAVLGVREILCYRLARPGTELRGVVDGGGGVEGEQERMRPPVE